MRMIKVLLHEIVETPQGERMKDIFDISEAVSFKNKSNSVLFCISWKQMRLLK